MILQDQDIYRIDTTDPDAFLWAGTFDIWNKDGPLEHYYNTYAITNDGMIAGSYNPRSPYYRVLSEFSDIAFKLHYYLPDWREKYEDLWRSALTSALEHCNAQ